MACRNSKDRLNIFGSAEAVESDNWSAATVKKRGNSWQATYRGPDGRERTKTFKKKVDGECWVGANVPTLPAAYGSTRGPGM